MKKNTRRLRLQVAYDGTNYGGWQVQPNANSIQAEIEKVLHTLTQKKTRVHASGRTDQGVHARAQVIHFDTANAMALRKMEKGINALLPADIRVSSLRRAADDFHSRFQAREKEYRYFIWNGSEVPPWLRQYRVHIRQPLDVKKMRRAARLLEGRHDFAAFSANPKRETSGTVREIFALKIDADGPEMVIRVRGDGFLYKMVRSLAGFLIRVGSGELEAVRATDFIEAGKRTHLVPTAPPQGLFLWRVLY